MPYDQINGLTTKEKKWTAAGDRSWVFATDSNFVIPISIQHN